MALALLLALALSGAEPATPLAGDPAQTPAAADAPVAASASTPAASATGEKAPTREEMEDAIPDGAPKDDYGLVAWCHGALAGQIELDPIVEKDMDSIEGKAKAAKRKAGDAEIAREHKRYLALYEKALNAAEKASPTAIHQQGVDAEVEGYKIWGATRNKAPIWRMVDWGNWEVPPRCEKAAKRLYDRASLFGEALKPETGNDAPPPVTDAGTPAEPGAAPSTDKAAPAADAAPDAKLPPAARRARKRSATDASTPAPSTTETTPAPPSGPAVDAPDPGKSAPGPTVDPKAGGDAPTSPQ